MRTCPPCFFESAQRSFDMAFRSAALERIVTPFGPGFLATDSRGLPTLPFSFGGHGVYSARDVLDYAFLFWVKGYPGKYQVMPFLRHD